MVLAFDGQHLDDVLLAADLALQLLAVNSEEALAVRYGWHLVLLLLLLWLLLLLVRVEISPSWALAAVVQVVDGRRVADLVCKGGLIVATGLS